MRTPESLRTLKAELLSDLDTLGKISTTLQEYLPRWRTSVPTSIEMGGMAYQVHNAYTTSENMFLRIARMFENEVDPAKWHVDLLHRMSLTIEKIRPAVLTDPRFIQDLDELRRFRHLFRHAYSVELQWTKISPLVELATGLADRMGRTMPPFLDFLDRLAEALENQGTTE